MNSVTDGCIPSVCTPSEGVHQSVLGVISSSSSLNVKNIPGLFLLPALLGVISSSPTWKLETISLGVCTPSVIFKVITPSLQAHGNNIPGECTLSAIYVIISSLPPWNIMKDHLTWGVQPLVRYWECNYPLPPRHIWKNIRVSVPLLPYEDYYPLLPFWMLERRSHVGLHFLRYLESCHPLSFWMARTIPWGECTHRAILGVILRSPPFDN